MSVRFLGLVFVVLTLIVVPTAETQPRRSAASPDEELLGIWAFDTTFARALNGTLTISRRGAAWHAALAGTEATFEASGHDVRFALRDELGRFRGKLTGDARTIEGFWIRPGLSGTRPANQSFASPVTLNAAGPETWRGTVRSLADSTTLYLRIFRAPDGALLAAFRNPDQNAHGGAMQYRVEREDGMVRFVAPISGAPALRHEATLVRDGVLRIEWPDFGRTIALRRQAVAKLAAFFPRPPGDPPPVYRAPALTGDGWDVARAREVGIHEDSLTRLVQRLAGADPSIRRASLIHSLLVAHRGKLVLEEYFHGFERERPHDTRSAGKTFASVMLGAAMMRGVKIDPETKAYDLLAGMGPFQNPSPIKSKITLAHLMTHTSGLACDDNDDASPGNENTMQAQRERPDWWKYTLDLPQVHEPGTRYAYCSANMNLMGAALTTATGTWLPELFHETIARPLQFGPYHWNLMPTDEGYLGGGAWLRPRDLLKVGQAYLDGGTWRGRRIVDSAWVARSTTSVVRITPATTGLTEEQFGEFYGGGEDGLAWHLGSVRSGDRDYPTYMASGNGGQVLIVIPALDMAVVFTGGNYRQGGIWGRWGGEIVGGAIIPAMKR